jgi:hypothetical protein
MILGHFCPSVPPGFFPQRLKLILVLEQYLLRVDIRKTVSASARLVFNSNLFTHTSYRVTVTTRNKEVQENLAQFIETLAFLDSDASKRFRFRLDDAVAVMKSTEAAEPSRTGVMKSTEAAEPSRTGVMKSTEAAEPSRTGAISQQEVKRVVYGIGEAGNCISGSDGSNVDSSGWT